MENFMPRRSKFAEGTMNSTASIRPPPEVLWRETTDSETNLSANAEATHKKWPTSSVTQITEAAPASAPTHEGNIFGRFSRAAASLFRGQGFSGLGKRKREDDSQAKETRKEEVERAYADAKRLGLLPEPTVYVRPVRRRRSPGPSTSASDDARTSTSSDFSHAGQPRLRSTPSKKDLHKQAKLRKKLSNLEHKLAKTREKLNEALNTSAPSPSAASFAPAMSPISASEPPTPGPVPMSQEAPEEIEDTGTPKTKKRKVSSDDEDADSTYRSTAATESEYESESAAPVTPRRTKSNKRARKAPGQARVLRKKQSRQSIVSKAEDVVIVVPDGATVPPIPQIPPEVGGKRVKIDKFGGLEHEIF